MPPKPSLTAAGRSVAAASGASKGGPAAGAGAAAAQSSSSPEEVPYALLSVRDKFASIRAKLQGEGEWTQEELFDMMYWLRQALGLAVGVLWGYLPWTGFVAFMAFVAANVVSASLLQGALSLDDDHPAVLGGELVSEGMPGSLSLFLVAWSLSYTAFHGGAAVVAAAAASG